LNRTATFGKKKRDTIGFWILDFGFWIFAPDFNVLILRFRAFSAAKI
jgi:hypothetical protein